MQINNSKSKINFNTLSRDYNLSSEIQFNFSSTNGITKVDGVIALLFWVFALLLYIIYTIIIKKFQLLATLIKINGRSYEDVLYTMPISIITIVTIVIILILRKQSFSTVLINHKDIAKSMFLGFAVSSPIIIIKIFNNTFSNGNKFIWPLIFYLFNISFTEEIIIRGFIQPRILVLIKNKVAAFFIVGWMWGMMHIPMQVVTSNQSILYIFLQDPLCLGFVLMHVIMLYLVTRFNNLIPAIVFHFFLDIKW